MDDKFVWKKKYEIGVYEIDAEHQIFLKIIKKVDYALKNKLDEMIISSIVKELFLYADFHFCSEENIMLANNYPDYLSHKEEHSKLLDTLSNLIVTFNVQIISHEKLMEMLTDWFINHTTKIDLKLGNYLNELPQHEKIILDL